MNALVSVDRAVANMPDVRINANVESAKIQKKKFEDEN